MSALLEVEGLDAWYGAARILHGLSLAVEAGEVVALLGRNGAGKSTTMKAIMGLAIRRAVRLSFAGQPIGTLPAYAIARLGLGYVPEDRRIFTDLTVTENLDIGRRPPPVRPDGTRAPAWTVERLFTLFPNLAAMPDRPGGQMSGGEQQMLTVARTLMGNPLLVLLDEPSEGVAPIIVEEMARTIIELKRAGVAILLSEQNLRFCELVCDRAYVIETGSLRWSGSMEALRADPALMSAYLAV